MSLQMHSTFNNFFLSSAYHMPGKMHLPAKDTSKNKHSAINGHKVSVKQDNCSTDLVYTKLPLLYCTLKKWLRG